MTGLFDHFPQEGEVYVTSDGIMLRVEQVDKKRITKVHIKLPKAEEMTETE